MDSSDNEPSRPILDYSPPERAKYSGVLVFGCGLTAVVVLIGLFFAYAGANADVSPAEQRRFAIPGILLAVYAVVMLILSLWLGARTRPSMAEKPPRS